MPWDPCATCPAAPQLLPVDTGVWSGVQGALHDPPRCRETTLAGKPQALLPLLSQWPCARRSWGHFGWLTLLPDAGCLLKTYVSPWTSLKSVRETVA